MYWLVVATLILALYAAVKVHQLSKAQSALTIFLEERLKEKPPLPEPTIAALAYGWFDDGWPLKQSPEKEIVPLKDPDLHMLADDYGVRTWMIEYQAK